MRMHKIYKCDCILFLKTSRYIISDSFTSKVFDLNTFDVQIALGKVYLIKIIPCVTCGHVDLINLIPCLPHYFSRLYILSEFKITNYYDLNIYDHITFAGGSTRTALHLIHDQQ